VLDGVTKNKETGALEPVLRHHMIVIGEFFGSMDKTEYAAKAENKMLMETYLSHVMPNTSAMFLTSVDPEQIMQELDKLHVVYKSKHCKDNKGCMAARTLDELGGGEALSGKPHHPEAYARAMAHNQLIRSSFYPVVNRERGFKLSNPERHAQFKDRLKALREQYNMYLDKRRTLMQKFHKPGADREAVVEDLARLDNIWHDMQNGFLSSRQQLVADKSANDESYTEMQRIVEEIRANMASDPKHYFTRERQQQLRTLLESLLMKEIKARNSV
jgi:hypothetical protein